MEINLSNLLRNWAAIAAIALSLAAGPAFAEVLSGTASRMYNVSYAASDEDRETQPGNPDYHDMPHASVSFATRRTGTAIIYFQTYLSYDMTPHRPGFQIVVDGNVVFETSRVGDSIFTQFAGTFSNNWVVPNLQPGKHTVKIRWKPGQGFPGDIVGDLHAFGSVLTVHHP